MEENLNKISIIVAMDRNRLIGNKNKLPWHIPEDFKWFVKHTKGKTVMMGDRTHESIGKKLPGRLNIVLSFDPDYKPLHKDVLVYGSLDQAIKLHSGHELMIIGGAQIYQAAMSYANRLYITRIDHEFEGDAYFPAYENDWVVVENTPGSNDQYNYEFQVLERRK